MQGVRLHEPANGLVLLSVWGGISGDVKDKKTSREIDDVYRLTSFLTTAAKRLLCRAALFGCIRCFRAARSSSCAAARYAASACSAVVAARTPFNAVRSAERWARLRTWRLRPWRIAFLADSILGTSGLLVRRGR